MNSDMSSSNSSIGMRLFGAAEKSHWRVVVFERFGSDIDVAPVGFEPEVRHQEAAAEPAQEDSS